MRILSYVLSLMFIIASLSNTTPIPTNDSLVETVITIQSDLPYCD